MTTRPRAAPLALAADVVGADLFDLPEQCGVRADPRCFIRMVWKEKMRSQFAAIDRHNIGSLIGFQCDKRLHRRPASLDEIPHTRRHAPDQQRRELLGYRAVGDETLDPRPLVAWKRVRKNG